MPDAALSQGHKIRQQDRDDGVHTTTANTRHGTGDTKLQHVLRQAASKASNAEDGVGEEEALLPAEDVTQLTIQRLEAGEGEEVAAGHDTISIDHQMSSGSQNGIAHDVAIQLV